MVGRDENILVEFDYQNIVVVDPNKIIDSLGNISERLLRHEDLVFYANLECNLLPRTRLAVGNDGSVTNSTVSIAKINFLKPNNSEFLDNSYLDEITGLGSTLGKGKNQFKEIIDTRTGSDGKKQNYIKQELLDKSIDNGLLLIRQISINTEMGLDSQVSIEMEDIRGRALFELGENSPYAVFFNYPYPIFYLTVKGYLGKAIRYQLALVSFVARFDADTGNFKITTTFQTYKYSILNNVLMQHVLAIPYMYRTSYALTPQNQSGPQSAQNTVGNTSQSVSVIPSSRGYEKMKEVYSEYKSKKLIPDDFPIMSVQELIDRMEQLEKKLIETFQKVDMSPMTDAENYEKILDDYFKEVYGYAGTNSWFGKYMDEENFLVLKGDKPEQKRRIYRFKKEWVSGANDQRNNAVEELKKLLIEKKNEQLLANKTFGKSGNYNIENKSQSSAIPVDISIKDFEVRITITDESIDYTETYKQRFGRSNVDDNSPEVTGFKNGFAAELTNVLVEKAENTKDNVFIFFQFEGPRPGNEKSFSTKIQDLKNTLATKWDEIKLIYADILSKRLSDTDVLGFKPTVRNVIAVILASAEAFIRMMCEVHRIAWGINEENGERLKLRQQAILGVNGSVKSVDARQSTETTSGNLIPIYPWPHYFEENPNKNERFELVYPGGSRKIKDGPGLTYDVWPEVEFVEEYIKGRSVTKEVLAENKLISTGKEIVDRVSVNAMDFPTSNEIFQNQQEVKFFYEIWERTYIYANYQRFNRPQAENQILQILADSEFLNIKNALGENNPYLTFKLKNYNFRANTYLTELKNFSNNGNGESWQKLIRDEFVTTYLSNKTKQDLTIFSEEQYGGINNFVSQTPKEVDKLSAYLKDTITNEFNLLDTFPFRIDGWFKEELAQGNSTNLKDMLNTSKVYNFSEKFKIIANHKDGSSDNEIRPITNFNYLSSTQPDTEEIPNLKLFYSNRTGLGNISKQQVTEGEIEYKDYSGGISSQQTTSILNTPFFTNAILTGIDSLISGNPNPFVSAAFLFLNSLPIATLREKYKTYNEGVTNDLDYLFYSFKKFGAVHKVPYAWILKYGSLWHRYKIFVEKNVDILDNVWKDFDAVSNFDPASTSRVYKLKLNGETTETEIPLEKTISAVSSNINEYNLGFYPKTINYFNYFYRGYLLFEDYNDTTIQDKLNSESGFTLTRVVNSQIRAGKGYSKTNPDDSLSINVWNTTLVDKEKDLEYVLPSFGSNVNQIASECLDEFQKEKVQIKSNPAIFNGSVRNFWALPNYGYFDTTKISKPNYDEYFKEIYSGQSSQSAFKLGHESGYTSIEEVFSVFSKDILDSFENEFLKFCNSIFDVSSKNVGNQTETTIKILDVYQKNTNKNFQALMRTLMSMPITSQSGLNSENKTNDVAKKQFDKINSDLASFLNYDVYLKYSNPGNFNRLAFDTYFNNSNLDDDSKLTFKPYQKDSLPTNNSSGLSLEDYKLKNPKTWATLETYVGFSDIEGIKYSNTGSTITDFFIDMDIEFTTESIKAFAPLIRIYATQKKLNKDLNKTSFITLINEYMNSNQDFGNQLLNMIFDKVRTDLVNVTERKINAPLPKVEGEQPQLELWETFKALNDTWIAGYDYTQTTFLEDVLILDRASRNVGDKVFMDVNKVKSLLNYNLNGTNSVYSYVYSLLSGHHMIPSISPGYVNYYGVQEVSKNAEPKIAGTLEFGNNLFGTYLNVDTNAASPKIVAILSSEGSKHLEIKNENNKFNSDSFQLTRSSECPLIEDPTNKEDFGLSNRVVGFNVDIGIRNQNVFYSFNVSQDVGQQTAESLAQMINLINQESGRQAATQNVSLYNYYKSRSYGCEVRCLGNALIQPTMYFNLKHVPMFNGTYQILKVKHNITPGKFETTFNGTRQQVFALPIPENQIQIFAKELFLSFWKNTFKQTINTNEKDNPQANANPTQAPAETTNTTQTTSNSDVVVTNTKSSIDAQSNCQDKLDNSFKEYVPVIPTKTTVDLNTMATKINQIENLEIARVLIFATNYMGSYNGAEFNSLGENYSQTRLNYKWPSELPNNFNKEYYCSVADDGISYPYAIFPNVDSELNLIKSKWAPIAENFTITPTSIADAWIRHWNKQSMTEQDLEKYKTTNSSEYEMVVKKMEDAIKLCQQLKIITAPDQPTFMRIEYLGEFTEIQGYDENHYNIQNSQGKYLVFRIVNPNNLTFRMKGFYNPVVTAAEITSDTLEDRGGIISFSISYNCSASVSTRDTFVCSLNTSKPVEFKMWVTYLEERTQNKVSVSSPVVTLT